MRGSAFVDEGARDFEGGSRGVAWGNCWGRQEGGAGQAVTGGGKWVAWQEGEGEGTESQRQGETLVRDRE